MATFWERAAYSVYHIVGLEPEPIIFNWYILRKMKKTIYHFLRMVYDFKDVYTYIKT